MERLRKASPPSAERVAEIEAEQGHDLAAFVSAVQESLGDEGSQIHLGMTSQDVVDTALALQLKEANALIQGDLLRLLGQLGTLAQKHRMTVMAGRTHGMHAEPVTFGFVLANHYDELHRSGQRVEAAAAEVVVGKLSGTVGTHATLRPEVEVLALQRLGLFEPAAITTQVVARDRHASYLCALAVLGAVCDPLGDHPAPPPAHRGGRGSRTVRRAAEGFVGNAPQAQPRAPGTGRRACRLLRGWAVAGLEDVALWHERDISHSSVERVALPDATMISAYILRSLFEVLGGLQVDAKAMQVNLERRGQISQSQQLLLALIRAGTPASPPTGLSSRSPWQPIIRVEISGRRSRRAPRWRRCWHPSRWRPAFILTWAKSMSFRRLGLLAPSAAAKGVPERG